MSDYTEGYKQCMSDFEHEFSRSMKANGGCKTTQQAWQVVNDLAYWTHKQALHIKQMVHEPQEEAIYMVFK